jgi:hypothetical protein
VQHGTPFFERLDLPAEPPQLAVYLRELGLSP